jgi:hypothetical protein
MQERRGARDAAIWPSVVEYLKSNPHEKVQLWSEGAAKGWFGLEGALPCTTTDAVSTEGMDRLAANPERSCLVVTQRSGVGCRATLRFLESLRLPCQWASQ